MWDFLNNDRSMLSLGTSFYVLAFAYAVVSMMMRRSHRLTVFYLLLTTGFAMQSYGLYHRGIVDQSFPLNNTFEILMVIGWCAVMLEFVIRPAFHLRLLGFFTSALAGALGALAFAVSAWDSPVPPPAEAVNPWIGFHAALAVFSYGIFAMLAMTAVMFLLQHYALRKRQSGGLFTRLPALTQLDDINKRLLLMGVSVLSIAIGLGFANWVNHPEEAVGSQKLVAALIVWMLYLGAHQLRARKILIASQFAWVCLLLFVLALLSVWLVTPHKQMSQPPATAAAFQHTTAS